MKDTARFRKITDWLEHEKRFHAKEPYQSAIVACEEALVLLGEAQTALQEAGELAILQGLARKANGQPWQEQGQEWFALANRIRGLLGDKP